MKHRGTCLDGPFAGSLFETDKDWIPVETTYKSWDQPESVKSVILTGTYVWSTFRNGFTYEKIAHVERHDKSTGIEE